MKKLALLLILLTIPATILISMEYQDGINKLDQILIAQATMVAEQEPTLQWVPERLLWFKNKPMINAQDELGNTRLHYAAFLRNGPIMIDLIKSGADPRILNKHDQDMTTILEYLILSLNERIKDVTKRIESSKKPNQRGRLKSEQQKLVSESNALKLEYQKIVRVLARSNVKIVFKDNETLLHKAIRLDDELLVIDLTSKIDPNIKNSSGKTALILAFSMNLPNELTLSQLLSHDANPNAQDQDGNAALHLAARNPNTDGKIYNLLLKNGANPDLRNNQHENAILTLLRAMQDSTKAYVLARKRFIDPSLPLIIQNMKQSDKNAELEEALDQLQNQVASFFNLFMRSRDQNMQDDFGNTPLYYLMLMLKNPTAIRKIIYPMMLHFIPNLNPNLQNKEGFTALNAAVDAQDLEAVQLMLDHGANPRLQSRETKSTILEFAKKILENARTALKSHSSKFDATGMNELQRANRALILNKQEIKLQNNELVAQKIVQALEEAQHKQPQSTPLPSSSPDSSETEALENELLERLKILNPEASNV